MSESDSENDLFPNNADVLSFQNQGTTVRINGPNISTNISGLSFRNNTTNTKNMPWNSNRPQYAESFYEPRNLDHRREQGGRSFSRSMYNGRSGSPMSVRSVRTIDSNISLNSKDIALAFRNGQLTKLDFKIIKDAYNKFSKGRVRKRKPKGFRRRPGGDSGDQASDSSISSDDCRSVKSTRTMYKENWSSCRSIRSDISYIRNTIKENNMIRDCSENFRPGVQQVIENMSAVPHRDKFKSSFLLPSQRSNQSCMSALERSSSRLQSINEGVLLDVRGGDSNHLNKQVEKNLSDSEQEEIFADVTVVGNAGTKRKRSLDSNENKVDSEEKRVKPSIPQTQFLKPKTPQTKPPTISREKGNDFKFAKPQLPIRRPNIVKNLQKSHLKPSKNLEKPASTVSNKTKPLNSSNTISGAVNKSLEQSRAKIIANSKQCKEKSLAISKESEEQIIASSIQTAQKFNLQPLEPSAAIPVQVEKTIKLTEKESCLETTQQCTTDLSMRPSFIKRKLFTQKVDDTDKNSSCGNLQAESPQTNIYSLIQKEKNKARKLVTTQSCLSRDVADDSNLLDLIHKIVPPDQINVTTATNRTELAYKNKSNPTNNDHSDISLLTTCNADELSDTYTDDEIFTAKEQEEPQNCPVVTQQQKPAIKNNSADKNMSKNLNKPIEKNGISQKLTASMQNRDDKKMPATMDIEAKNSTKKNLKPKVFNKKTSSVPENVPCEIKNLSMTTSKGLGDDLAKRPLNKCVKAFWDSDSESEFEATLKMNTTVVQKPAIEVTHKNPPSSLNKSAEKPLKPNTINSDNRIQKQTNSANNASLKEKTIVKSKVKSDVIQKQTKKTTAKADETINKNNKNNKSISKTNKKTPKKTAKKNQSELKSSDAIKKPVTTSTKSKLNNNTVINNNNKYIQLNTTLSKRPQRKAKVKKCCDEPEPTEKRLNETSNTLYMSLRTRQVNQSISLTSNNNKPSQKNKKNTSVTKKSTTKISDEKRQVHLESDMSLTFTPPPTRRQMTAQSSVNIHNKRNSDVSFTLTDTPDKCLYKTITTRSSLRRNKEIESLQRNLSALHKNSGPGSIAMNRSTRLNRSIMR